MPSRRKSSVGRASPRSDLGAPIEGFMRIQPAPLRAILEELRRLVEQAAPGVQSSLKWGMPCFTLDGRMICMLGGHKAHVNLVLVGPEGTFADPSGRLVGTGKGGRHLKLRALEEIPRTAVLGWVRAAAKYARSRRRNAR
jgi:hypothetical protein